MKTAVVFYTRDGSTKAAAQLIAEKLGADIFELEETKKRSGSAFSFMAAGFGASAGLKSRLNDDFSEQMDEYERICIGSPVWASRTVPAVNAFAHSLDAAGKRIMLFTVQADPKPTEKSVEKLKKKLEKQGAFMEKTLCLHGAGPGRTAAKEDLATQIAAVLP